VLSSATIELSCAGTREAIKGFYKSGGTTSFYTKKPNGKLINRQHAHNSPTIAEEEAVTSRAAGNSQVAQNCSPMAAEQ